MNSPVRIGFTGNRHGLTANQRAQILLILDQYDHMILAHGDCVGSDTDFHQLCVDYRARHPQKTLRIDIYPPNITTLRAFNAGDAVMPPKPYLERNLDIVLNSTILIGCPMDKHKEEWRSGTWSTIRKARQHQLTVHIL